nr:glycoside hydrolase family 31 protein [Calditrichia bacterium]
DFLYIQWAMGLGSFSPIWRPHGIGENRRWPLDREGAAREAARQYGKMRYEMMPYLYSMAHQARQSGLPMARAMVIDYRDQAEAWARDLQYMWGDAFLVAPVCAEQDSTAEVWLPGGADWYDYWTREKVPGNQVLRGPAAVGKIPLWVKAGAIVPTHPYAQSTAELDPSQLILNLYTGGEGTFTLYEDDGISERFRTRAELRSTTLTYREKERRLTIAPASGTYPGAPEGRSYTVRVFGLDEPRTVTLNGRKLTPNPAEGYQWDAVGGQLTIRSAPIPVEQPVTITF